MYKIRKNVYADAGCILVGKNLIGYMFPGEMSEFTEESIRLSDMRVEGKYLLYSNDMIKEIYYPNMTYEQLKAKYVKRLFSNDDQIAIMLNKDRSAEDAELFDKMQEYRDWCGTLAKKVISIKQTF